MTTTSILSFLIGLLIGLVVSIFIVEPRGLTEEQILSRIAAYEHCMENAGKLGCRMQPTDFIEYYELKDKLIYLQSSAK